jgi:hypothetical protein
MLEIVSIGVDRYKGLISLLNREIVAFSSLKNYKKKEKEKEK